MKKRLTTFLLVFSVALMSYCQEGAFVSYQSILTEGANDFKTFVIDNDTYLAIACFTNNESEEISSKIYRWENNEFQLFQEIGTKGASDWEFFEIDGNFFLAVANYEDNETKFVNSIIYQWNGSQFNFFQSIPTIGAYDWEFFEIEDIPYLVVANQTDGENNNINSVIYQWDGEVFQEFQSIPCFGATDWESFTVNGNTYLAIANVLDFVTRIYKWNGGDFELYQTLLFTLATTGVESFSIDEQFYLAISSGTGTENYNSISKIFILQDTTFIEFQDLTTAGAFDWEYFTMNDDHFLVVANYKESDENYMQNSEIFKWNGTEFESFQTILTHAAVDWEYCEINGESYLMVAEYKELMNRMYHIIPSRIFRFDEYSTVFVQETELNNPISIFPNPAQDAINITITGENGLEEFTVSGTKGKLLIQGNSKRIDISHLPAGNYFLQVNVGQTVYTKSFVKR